MKDRILVVDDLELWRVIFKTALEKDFEVDTAASLKEAIELLKEAEQQSEPYRVVITDIGLSKDVTNEDGIEVLKTARNHSPFTRTIAVSGRAAVVDKAKFEKEYQALVYLERDEISDNMDIFINKVAQAVALSHKDEEKA